MRGDIPLGRLAGIKVGANWSVAAVAAVYTVILATNQLPATSAGQSSLAYWAAGGLGALLFFGSLLVHEMGHALVAREEGIGVQGISLWLLGGVARLESSPTDPGSEFRIAVVGPLGSAACSAFFLSLAYVLPSGGLAGLTGALFAWLGLINGLLAIFNLLPASPLDGGTVLSSIIWWRTGRQSTGMTWSARVGIATGGTMLAYGLWSIGHNSNRFDFWIAGVGAFIVFNAWNSLRAAPLYDALEGITAADAMVPAPAPVPGRTSVSDFLLTLPRDTPHRSYPILGDNGRVTGLLTVEAVQAVPPVHWNQLAVADLAFPIARVTVIPTVEPLLPAIQKLESAGAREALVVAPDGTIVGTLHVGSLHTAIERRRTQQAVAHH